MNGVRSGSTAGRVFSAIVLVAFFGALALVFFGGRIEVSLQPDVRDVHQALIVNPRVRQRFGTILEAEVLPNPYDRGFSQLEKKWRVEESESTRTGYFTFRVVAEGLPVGGPRLVGNVRIHFHRTGTQPVEVTRIE